MAVTGAQPSQYANGRLNMWAMLRALVNNNVGILVLDSAPTATSFAGFAGPGTLLIDNSTAILYRNVGTKAVPIWQGLGPTSAQFGTGVMGNVKVTYDFAVDGGAIGAIIPTSSPTLPINSIILGGTIDITTQLTSGGLATIAVGTTAGSSASSLKAATAVASYTAGQLAVVPVFTAATYVKLTAAGRINITVAAFALTAGKMDINLVYLIGNA